jgi:putative endonuclease
MRDDRAARREGGRLEALRRGRRAEQFAAAALMAKGYRIVGRNYRCRAGEIDIIVRRGDLIAFVEVKARATVAEAVDAVSAEAQRRIANAAEHWLARRADAGRLSWRFDIVAVQPRRWPVHLPDAF